MLQNICQNRYGLVKMGYLQDYLEDWEESDSVSDGDNLCIGDCEPDTGLEKKLLHGQLNLVFRNQH